MPSLQAILCVDVLFSCQICTQSRELDADTIWLEERSAAITSGLDHSKNFVLHVLMP
jgi:hypothetical protein